MLEPAACCRRSSCLSCSSINLASMDPGAAPAPHAPPDPTLMSTKSCVTSLLAGPCVALCSSSSLASFISWSFAVVWLLSSFFTRTGPATGAFSSSSSSSSTSISAAPAASPETPPPPASTSSERDDTATFGVCFFGRLGTTGTTDGSGCRFCRLESMSSCRIINCCSAYSNQSSSKKP